MSACCSYTHTLSGNDMCHWFIQEGKSALMLVCECGHISLVLTVLDSGAEIDFQQKVVKINY